MQLRNIVVSELSNYHYSSSQMSDLLSECKHQMLSQISNYQGLVQRLSEKYEKSLIQNEYKFYQELSSLRKSKNRKNSLKL